MKPTPDILYNKSNGFYYYFILLLYYIYIFTTNQLDTLHIILGILILSLFIFSKTYKIINSKKKKNLLEKREIELEKFKKRANSVIVELNNVGIKSNDWTNKKTVTKHIGNKKYEEEIEEELTLNRIHFEIPYEGQKINIITEPFYIDRKNLEITLAIKKSTLLYINPKDKNDYFLDLDFLDIENN
ncbi:hypothetical protein H3Z83_02630 [Tenacibaculum sp. S7007]|uniref:Uncharacterized protein n=1 Tax=Tenacibaculum pelagium TaxID=2759527 RepID=A0A839ALX8_9FLAO|nr:hypothetical protein [Tenacibaculum pelagium]MBA6155426.1 hypothetical protein [Tenacibaculum pelagium]